MKPRYVQRKRLKGWRMPPNTVSCTRPGPLGNPFPVRSGDATLAVERFRTWLNRRSSHDPYHDQRWELLDALRRARGKNLACWCKPGAPCHVQDVLLGLANEAPWPR